MFLICFDFKVQKSVFIPGRTPSVALSHISFVGLQTNRQQYGVEGLARPRFDKLDFAVIDAESTAESNKVETKEGCNRRRWDLTKKYGKKKGSRKPENEKKKLDQRKCLRKINLHLSFLKNSVRHNGTHIY